MKRYIITIIMISLLIVGYISFVDVVPKPLAAAMVLMSGELKSIDSINITATGPIYRQIIGSDFKGYKKVLWLDKKIVKSIRLKDGITENKAVDIAKQLGINKIDATHLLYKPLVEDPGLISPSVPEGVYWYIRGEKVSLFIDFLSGSIVSKYKEE